MLRAICAQGGPGRHRRIAVPRTGVLVPDDRVLANRLYGVIDPPLQVIASIAMPIISAVYLGVAETAFAAATAVAKADDGALAAVGDDPEPSVNRVAAVMAAKREIALAGIEVCDLAREVAGGAAFYKGSVIERCYREIRAIKFHPLTPEQTLIHAGRFALGPSVDQL